MPETPSSLRLPDLAGIPLRIRRTLPDTVILVGLFLFIAFPDSDAGLALLLGVLGVLLSVVVHEFGHALAARMRGLEVHEIEIHLVYAVTRTRALRSAGEELWVAFGGPLASLLLAAAAWGASKLLPEPPGPLGWPDFIAANLALGLVNLLPVFPMDGGRMVKALLQLRLGEERAFRSALLIGRVLAIALISLPLFWARRYAWAGPFLGALVLFLGEVERRRLEGAAGTEEPVVLGACDEDDRVSRAPSPGDEEAGRSS